MELKEGTLRFFGSGGASEIQQKSPFLSSESLMGREFPGVLFEALSSSKKWPFFCNWLILRLTGEKLLITFVFVSEAGRDLNSAVRSASARFRSAGTSLCRGESGPRLFLKRMPGDEWRRFVSCCEF